MSDSESNIRQQITDWLNTVVLGLKLCPFAVKPCAEDRVKIVISTANSETGVLQDLQSELQFIDRHDNEQVETTLLVIAECLHNFYDFNQFIDMVDDLFQAQAWSGEYQIATFHPAYQFANTQADDAENLTNRSPYPILQILRESSLEQQLNNFPNPQRIPDNNIRNMNTLSDIQKRQYFPYLFPKK